MNAGMHDLLEELLADSAEASIEVHYRGRLRSCGAGIILTNHNGQEYLFERPAVVNVKRVSPRYWPPRDGELWREQRNGFIVHWVCGLGDEDDGDWVLYPNDPSYAPVSEAEFRKMPFFRQEELFARKELAYSPQRDVTS